MQFLRFDSLQNVAGLHHAITTRAGAGDEPYNNLNLAYHVGDDAGRVTENRKKLAAELGYDAARLVAAQQVHSNSSHIITEADAGRGAFDWDSALVDCDALIVQEPGVPVLIQVADCAPILLVDPKNHVLAVIHAGWRGAVAQVTSQALAKMQSKFSTRVEDVKAGIGPCLCVNCFEVGPEVVEAAQEIAPEAVLQCDKWDKPHLDLRLLIQCDLKNTNVPPEDIEIMPHCPRCQNDLFFSHRGQNGTAGRFGLVGWWEK